MIATALEHVGSLVPPDEERQLIEQAIRDPIALTHLYRLHYGAIHAYVLRRVGDRHDADDLTAEVFLTMVRSLTRFRWQGVPFRAWLYRIATNQVNRWASRKRRRAATQQLDEQLLEHGRANVRPDATWDVEILQLALISLAPRFQSTLSLFYLEEMTVAEIAEVLGCRVGTVKSRLSRGRSLLRKYFEKRGGNHES